MTVRVNITWTFCKCSRWLEDIFRRQHHNVKVTFSNSLLIREGKTKKITTVTVVWNYHNILQALSLNVAKNYNSFEKLYQKWHEVFYPISRQREVGWKTKEQPSFLGPTSTAAFISQTSKTTTPCSFIY